MLRSLFSGLSGLNSQQTGLDVIGNNIANVNTVGFKSSTIQFSELLSQTISGASSPVADGIGGTNPLQVGLGVGTAAIDVSHQQGNLQATGTMSDLAIQGNGFFIVSDGANTAYTRAGAFSFDANGTMVTGNGMKVMGWMADRTGVINQNSSITGITIPVGQTISANPTSVIDYAHNLDSRSDMQGTPVLATGNSANVDRVYGKYTGDPNAVDESGNPFPVTDVVGTHYITVNSETHTGDRNNLNGTETLASEGVTDLSTFQVVVDGTAHTVTLSNGTNSSVNELISAINSQVTGVTAQLSNNAVSITRNRAGLDYGVYVQDTGFATDGIAANIFSTGDGKWAEHAKSVGTATHTPTDTLGAIDPTDTLNVKVGNTTYTYQPSAHGITTANTVSDLITSFNTWSQGTALGSGANAVFMGLNAAGNLYVADNSHDTKGYVTISDLGNGSGTNKGIADTLFAKGGSWATDPNVAGFGKTSIPASVSEYYEEKDGGGTHVSQLSFSNGDATITGIDGVNIIGTTDGFKTGSMVINTVPPADQVVSTNVYDSLGNSHAVTLTLQRVEDNSWTWTASGIDTTGSGTLTFDSNGAIQSGASNGTISIGAQGGASSISITPNFTSVTQYADTATMVNVSQDGYANGSLSTYSIDGNGNIQGIYTNGLNQTLGKLAIAAFNNPGGLQKISDSEFIESNNSGSAQVGDANSGGRGALSAGTLEMSNVDIAQEFSQMIIYERGFQANSKVITTGDDLLQTLVGMKR